MLTDIICVVCLVPATAVCLYYLVFALAARRGRLNTGRAPTHTFAILIPAHNEQDALPATLRSVFALEYPADMVRVYVVADNCTDNTAAVASEAGVLSLVRTDPERRGKGFALAFGLDAVRADNPDAVLILDADCELDPRALQELDAVFASGAEAAQLDVQSANADEGPAGYVAAVGDALEGFVTAGLDRFGCSVPLRGTGMAFRLSALQRVPWSAFSPTEDAEYSDRLRAAGVRVRLAGGRVSCAAPPRVRDLCQQRRRWRGALFSGGWGALPFRAGRSKPLVLLHLFLTTAFVLAVAEPVYVWWALALVALTAAVYLRAVLAVGLSWRRIGLLLATPLVVARLAWLALAGVVRRRSGGWEEPAPTDTHPPKGSATAPTPVTGTQQFARRPARLMRFLHGVFVTSRSERSSFVSLTFDDGPHSVYTPAVLDRLRRYQTTATFYLIGERIATAPHLPELIAGEGHALGNHTYSHPRFAALSRAEPLRELTRCQDSVPYAGTFRPPFGRLTPGVLLAARRLGLPVVMWSIDSGDWQCESADDAIACAHQVLELVRPGDIVLLHDDRPWIEPILDVLLPGLVSRGLLEAPASPRTDTAPAKKGRKVSGVVG
jgi:peptidoglycan/xylan/chitin deacetylase (PgdA/CDA1 family)